MNKTALNDKANLEINTQKIINGKKFIVKLKGGAKKWIRKNPSRAEVFHGKALQTSGGLTKNDLFKDKYGNLKSKKAEE